MQKQALTVGNINYAAYRDSDNLFSPIESTEEFILLKSALTNNTLKVITLADLITPVQFRSFYYFSSFVGNGKFIDLKVKDDSGSAVFRINFAINSANVTLPQVLLQPTFTIELAASANVESINFVCKKVGFVDIKNK
jgi:hypothetical protein